MSTAAPARSSEPQARALRYERHRLGQILLYRIVAQHYPAFVEHMARPGKGRRCEGRCAHACRAAQRLKRVFGIDVQTCAGCGGTMRIIARIEEPGVIKTILAHLAGKVYSAQPRLPPRRAPPAPAFS